MDDKAETGAVLQIEVRGRKDVTGRVVVENKVEGKKK